jgi:hypothetical protein
VQQFVNAGQELKLQPEKTQRYVITGRASGKVTEIVVETGRSHTVRAESESLRIEAFDASAQTDHEEGGLDFRMTSI